MGSHRGWHFRHCSATRRQSNITDTVTGVSRLLCTGPCILLCSTRTSLLSSTAHRLQRCSQFRLSCCLAVLSGLSNSFSGFWEAGAGGDTSRSRPGSYLSSQVVSSKRSSNCCSQRTAPGAFLPSKPGSERPRHYGLLGMRKRCFFTLLHMAALLRP